MIDWNPGIHKTAYILGAGTSACAGAPLIGNFRNAAVQTHQKMPDPAGPHLDTHFNRQMFGAALTAWLGRFGTYNIEEFYVLADLHERMRIDYLFEIARASPPTNAVRYLICKTLHESMNLGPSNVHKAFVNYTWHHAAEKPYHGAVITLNWDIALDNAVDRYFGSAALDPGYANFRPWQAPGKSVANRSYTVLKLHGSMNWWFCNRCKALWYDVGEKGILGLWEGEGIRSCSNPDCGGVELVPAMIPPMSQKMDSSTLVHVLQEIWLRARRELTTCNWLVVAGYSFPPTDVQFRMFLADALAANPDLQGLTVVTNRKVGNDRAAFEDSYAQLIGALPDHINVTFRYEGFERWVKDSRCSR